MSALTRAWPAERLATTRTRMASTAPSRDLGLPIARPLSAARAASTASRGVGLARPPALLSVRSVDFDDLYAGSAQVAGQARAIRAGALHADLDDVSEALEPLEQRPVARTVRGEALRSKQSAEGIEGCCDVDVTMRIDTTGDPTRLLRWSWSSLLF
jgi:hypothetical protein